MSLPTRLKERLHTIAALEDGQIDLANAAVVLGSIDRPEADLAPYFAHLRDIADEVAKERQLRANSDGLRIRLSCLQRVLSGRFGYHADVEADGGIGKANILDAIDTRSGPPIVLGLLYIHAARAQGWEIAGLDFPSQFMVRLVHGSQRLVVDPYNDGMIIEPQDMRALLKAIMGNQAELSFTHHQTLGNRDILLRLQSDKKARLVQEDRLPELLAVLESMAILAPDLAEPWREAGLINARLGRFDQAIGALESFLVRGGSERARYNASLLLRELRTQTAL